MVSSQNHSEHQTVGLQGVGLRGVGLRGVGLRGAGSLAGLAGLGDWLACCQSHKYLGESSWIGRLASLPVSHIYREIRLDWLPRRIGQRTSLTNISSPHSLGSSHVFPELISLGNSRQQSQNSVAASALHCLFTSLASEW